MDIKERCSRANSQIESAGIDCTVASARPESVTLLCGAGVMAYLDGKLLMLGEQVPVGEKPVTVYISDAVSHRDVVVNI